MKDWTRRINYTAQEPGDSWPRRHMYVFTTLETVRPEHRTAIALLDATSPDDNYVKIKDVGEKLINPDNSEVIYVVLSK